MESGDSFLVVIVDVNSGSWDDPAEGCGAFSDALQSLYLFCNSHKMLGRNNNSCMIAMGERSSAHVSSSGGSAIDAVLAEYGDSSRPAASGHCALGRCLSQAMCGIKSHSIYGIHLASLSIIVENSVINRHLLVRSGTQCRILVVQASADLPESYNAVMNAIFRLKLCLNCAKFH